MFSKGGGFAPGELARNLHADRFHAEEVRARALAMQQQRSVDADVEGAEPRRGEELRVSSRESPAFATSEFAAPLRGELHPRRDDFVDEFERFSLDQRAPSLDEAFVAYLRTGVATPVGHLAVRRLSLLYAQSAHSFGCRRVSRRWH